MNNELYTLMKTFNSAKHAEKEARAEKEQARTAILEYISKHPNAKLCIDGVDVTYQRGYTKRVLDTTRLKKEHAKLCEKYYIEQFVEPTIK